MQEQKEEFCIVDLWAAEAYLTALDAGETVMLDMLGRGEKIHNWMFNEINSNFPQEVKDAKFVYKDAKQVVHLSDYGGGAGKIHEVSRLPLYVSDWASNRYHNTFPGIRGRMRRIEEEIKATRTLVSLLGRKKIFFGLYNQDLLNQAYAWGSQSVIGELTINAMTKLYWMGVLYKNKATMKSEDLILLSPNILQIPWTFPALETHDGLAIRCYKNNREAVKDSVRKAFNVPFKKGEIEITIPVEIGWSDNFNDIYDVEIIKYT